MHLGLARLPDPEELIALLEECLWISGLRRQDEMIKLPGGLFCPFVLLRH